MVSINFEFQKTRNFLSNYHILTIRLNLNQRGRANSKKNRRKLKARENIRRQNPDGHEDGLFVTVSVFQDEKKAIEIRKGKIRTQGSSYWRKFGAEVLVKESSKNLNDCCIRRTGKNHFTTERQRLERTSLQPKNSYVYIINLKESVNKETRFQETKSHKGPFKGYLYVGQTTKDPVSERYRIHTMKVNGKRHHHASKIVHNHYLDIAWDLFEEHQDPMTKLESLRMEKQLAISYKKKGYATYWN